MKPDSRPRTFSLTCTSMAPVDGTCTGVQLSIQSAETHGFSAATQSGVLFIRASHGDIGDSTARLWEPAWEPATSRVRDPTIRRRTTQTVGPTHNFTHGHQRHECVQCVPLLALPPSHAGPREVVVSQGRRHTQQTNGTTRHNKAGVQRRTRGGLTRQRLTVNTKAHQPSYISPHPASKQASPAASHPRSISGHARAH